VQYSIVYTTTVHVHTHFIRFFGPPNTQSDTELFIDKLHRTSASEIYIYDFFYTFILFVLKIPPLRCARIISSCITLNVTVSLLLYTYTYKCMVYGYIYIIIRHYTMCSSRARSRGFITRARCHCTWYNNIIYDVYVHEMFCNGIRSRIRTNFQKCDTI